MTAVIEPIEGTDCFIEKVEDLGNGGCAVWRVYMPACSLCGRPNATFDATGSRDHAESFAFNPEYLICDPCASRGHPDLGGEG